jgi:hypothetical protein
MKNFFPTVVNKPWIHEELQEETFRVKGNTVIHANEGEKKGSSDNKHVNKRWHSCTCGIPRHRESPFSSSFLFLELKILILDLGK